MLVRWGLIRKKPDWELDAFRRHWIGPHANLAKQLKGLRGYVQNHVIDHEQGAITLPRGPDEYDGFPELWFHDDDAMLAAVADLGPRLGADEAYFLGDLRILVAEQQDLPSFDDERTVKHVALIRRAPHLSPGAFQKAWMDSVDRTGSMPGMRGARRSLILDRQVPKGTQVDYARLPIDGIAEFWSAGSDGLAAAFQSLDGREWLKHAGSSIAEMTVFRVEAHVIA